MKAEAIGTTRRVIVRPRGEKGAPAPGAGVLGMGVFLASLGVLFLAGLAAFWVVRLRAPGWPPAGAAPLPASLWASTVLLGGCSVAVQGALRAIRVGDRRRLLGHLHLTNLLALAFLGAQSWSWWRFFDASTFYRDLYGFTFYMLTGLHAAHVLGGVVALAVVTLRATMGAYSWAYYPGVRNAAIYWHFLDGVWLVLFASLLATS